MTSPWAFRWKDLNFQLRYNDFDNTRKLACILPEWKPHLWCLCIIYDGVGIYVPVLGGLGAALQHVHKQLKLTEAPPNWGMNFRNWGRWGRSLNPWEAANETLHALLIADPWETDGSSWRRDTSALIWISRGRIVVYVLGEFLQFKNIALDEAKQRVDALLSSKGFVLMQISQPFIPIPWNAPASNEEVAANNAP